MSLKNRRLKIYRCAACGNMVYIIESSGITPQCCGSEMELVIPNTVDAAFEKHVPEISRIGSCVRVNVGERAHPMTASHYIKWIAVETDKGVYAHKLTPSRLPSAFFSLDPGEVLIGAYAYCNLHGLWFGEEHLEHIFGPKDI